MGIGGDYLTKVCEAIYNIFVSSVSEEYEEPLFNSYPFERARKGHNEAISKILQLRESIFGGPTGVGKTACSVVAAAEYGSAVIVEPRNALQEQVAKYDVGKELIPLFDRSKHCNKKSIEDKYAPCAKKYRKSGKWVFKLDGREVEYPCMDCPYEHRKYVIKRAFPNCIPVLNQGNFWLGLWLRYNRKRWSGVAEGEKWEDTIADDGDILFIVDEADETLRSVTDAVSCKGVFEDEDAKKVLAWMEKVTLEEIGKIEKALEKERDEQNLIMLNKTLERLEKKLGKIWFFKSYDRSKLLVYVRRDTTYVEIFDDIVNVARKLFPRFCLVSATIADNSVPVVEVSAPFRAKVIYAPVGNLSVRSTLKDESVFDKAAEVIMKTYDYTVKLTGMRKSPIHCGNLAKHGHRIFEILSMNGRKALLMEEGNQLESVRKFLEGDYDFFCAVAVEYGFDWAFAPIQYVLKVPFADLTDPRIKAIRKLLKDKFNDWYNWDALSRVIQASGRNARGPNDFGVTIILDSCFGRLYRRYESKIPEWFKSRVIWLADEDKEVDADGEVAG